MGLEEIKDTLSEKLSESWSKIQESPTYNSLRERYDTLSPPAQKGLIAGGIVLSLLLLLSIPYSYISSSSASIAEYNDQRSLIRNLLRASRLASEASTIPAAMPAEEVKGRVQNELSNFNLLPEQIGGVIDLANQELGGALAPSSIRQAGVGVSLKKLNLKQIVDIGFKLQDINPSVKMAGVDITASAPDPRYFDVLFKLVTFSLPESAQPAEESSTNTPRQRRVPIDETEEEN